MQIFIRVVLFFSLVFLVELYFLRKVAWSVKFNFKKILSSKISFTIKAIVIFLNIYPTFLIVDWIFAEITKSSVLIPQNLLFDYFIIYPVWIFILIAVQCALFFIIFDLLKFISFPVWKQIKEEVNSIIAKIILLIVISFLIYVPARVIYDYNTIQIRTVEYKKENLPYQLNNFRIVLISDIHADRYTNPKRLQKFINNVNSIRPDLVLIGGDMISSSPEYISEAAKYIGKIKSKHGVYSCVGDHDFWAYRNDSQKSLNEVETDLRKYKVEMIDDGKRTIDVDGAEIGITFITNTYVEHITKSVLDQLTSDTTKYGLKILISHQPKQIIVDKAVEANYDLLLAGHTHGGQVTFLFPFKNLTPTMFETKYIRGNFYFGKMLMVVTRGLGMSLVPMRYNSTPEVTLINISR